MKPPTHLKQSKEIWDLYVKDLPESLHSILQVVCEAWDRKILAQKKIIKDGEYITQHNGVISQAPWLKTERESWHTFMRGMKQLGLGQAKLGRPPDKRHKREKQGEEIEDLLSR